ncbi:unnamed protein product [Mytilus edulis]|uniref:Uncharacterized protein n=1 Tax=Mytilus edulis TaxID=6550 RepID=A0A8S3VAH0_MYTED|nr:unnamed protein product [Mytilus edulis]
MDTNGPLVGYSGCRSQRTPAAPFGLWSTTLDVTQEETALQRPSNRSGFEMAKSSQVSEVADGVFFLVFLEDNRFGVVAKNYLVNIAVSELTDKVYGQKFCPDEEDEEGCDQTCPSLNIITRQLSGRVSKYMLSTSVPSSSSTSLEIAILKPLAAFNEIKLTITDMLHLVLMIQICYT